MTDRTVIDITPPPNSAMLADAMFLEGIALYTDNPEAALARLQQHRFTELPTLARILEATLQTLAYNRRNANAVEDLPGGLHDQARQARWARDPGAHLPGAARARFFRPPPGGFGHVTYAGSLFPWTYVSGAYAAGDLAELVVFAEEEHLHRGIAVCSPATAAMLRDEGLLPDGYIAVGIELGGRAA